MINNHKLQGFLSRVNGDQRPITADLFLTDFCNEKCAYCRYSHSTGKYMRFSEFTQYANILLSLGVKSIILTGGGEPTVNPDFDKIADWLERNNVPYGVNTNLVDLHYISPVFLKVSIDAGTKEKYRRIRGVDFFDHVLSNLSDYIQYKAKIGSQTKIGVQCVALDKDTVVEFYNAIRRFNVDYIYFRPFENKNGHITDKEILQQIDAISLEDHRVNKSFKFSLENFKVPYCIGNWSSITVNCEGFVPYCCHRPYEIVGHITDKNILQQLREHHIDTSTCEVPCRLSGANHFLMNNKSESDYCFV